MTTLTIKKGDTEPVLTATLERDGTAYDISNLSNPSVQFRMGSTNNPPIVDAQATIVTASNGEVKYEWQAGDTDTVGTYKSEFVVTGDNTETTFPSDGFFYITVLKDVQP